MKVIGHLVGMDEIHKRKLSKKINFNVNIIDLDEIQQKVYNSREITQKKTLWGNISKDIQLLQKQKRMILQQKKGTKNLEKNIKQLMSKRNSVKKEIYSEWKNQMHYLIDQIFQKSEKKYCLFIGFNLFPKDLRVHINLPLQIQHINLAEKKISNQLIYNIKSKKYASNQIKNYLVNYSDKIIGGTFPLNLLQIDYLSNRYDKLVQHYDRLGYSLVDDNELLEIIEEFRKYLDQTDQNEYYLVTYYRAGKNIPVNSKTPLMAYPSREKALEDYRSKIKEDRIVYLYKISSNQFEIINGNPVATKEVEPLEEESVFLTALKN